LFSFNGAVEVCCKFVFSLLYVTSILLGLICTGTTILGNGNHSRAWHTTRYRDM